MSEETAVSGGGHRKANNMGLGFAKRYHERRASSVQMERAGDGGHVLVKSADGTARECEIVSSAKHASVWSEATPKLPLALAIVCALLNLAPGLGTLVAAALNLCVGKKRSSKRTPKELLGWQVLTAFLQIILAPLIIGIVWSIMYAVNMVQLSTRSEENEGNGEMAGAE